MPARHVYSKVLLPPRPVCVAMSALGCVGPAAAGGCRMSIGDAPVAAPVAPVAARAKRAGCRQRAPPATSASTASRGGSCRACADAESGPACAWSSVAAAPSFGGPGPLVLSGWPVCACHGRESGANGRSTRGGGHDAAGIAGSWWTDVRLCVHGWLYRSSGCVCEACR
ncbi:hypothetical protein BC831DRAFT_311999 [Entophlyctis helioformis]|nr:hypothetical protein BC831DRAFT_311999 [Entophlyctis helioformis]